jgi:hypothetical protein
MSRLNRLAVGVLGAALLTGAGSALAIISEAPIPSVDFSSQACSNYGDFQSCSAQYLNFLTTGSPTGNATTNYVIQSSQGLLQPALVIMTNGQAAVSNTDIGTNIDNAYNILASPGQDTVYGTSILAGEKVGQTIVDPTTAVVGEVSGPISGFNGGGAAATAWDIGLQALITALTDGEGNRHDLLVFFDNNQEGVTGPQDILISGLICVRDAQGILPDKCFELVDENGLTNTNNNVNPTAFNTSLNYGSPLPVADLTSNSAVLANGSFCVDNTSKDVVAFNVASKSDCPANSTFINNNLGSNVVEFIAGIPELNKNLEQYLAQGYDLVSTQLLFTNQNDGFEDVFILAGGVQLLAPEPGTLMLLGLGVLALAFASRRRLGPSLR